MASTSLVVRGRPRREAATPPITRPSTFCDVNQSTRLRIAASSGLSGDTSDTVEFPQSVPALPHSFDFDRIRGLPMQLSGRFHQGRELFELLGYRRRPELLSLSEGDLPPTLGESSDFLWFHRHWRMASRNLSGFVSLSNLNTRKTNHPPGGRSSWVFKCAGAHVHRMNRRLSVPQDLRSAETCVILPSSHYNKEVSHE